MSTLYRDSKDILIDLISPSTIRAVFSACPLDAESPVDAGSSLVGPVRTSVTDFINALMAGSQSDFIATGLCLYPKESIKSAT